MPYWTTFLTCWRSYLPRTHFSFTPGQSCTRPPRTRTMWCSCKLCPIPGTYATASRPVLRRTRTHFLFAEFGFLGFLITVFSTTPLINGFPPVALLRFLFRFRGPSRCSRHRNGLTELSNDGTGNGLITFVAFFDSYRTLRWTGDILQWGVRPASGAEDNDECTDDDGKTAPVNELVTVDERKPLLNPTKTVHKNCWLKLTSPDLNILYTSNYTPHAVSGEFLSVELEMTVASVRTIFSL